MSIQEEAARIEMLAGLERALDNNFGRLRENARAQWEKHFTGIDPSDVCVSVRIIVAADAQLPPVACAGFLPAPKQSCRGKINPRLA
jgi:hypothetical protein